MRAVPLLATIVAFAFSLAMIRQLVGVASPWFGVLLMFCVLGIVAMARPLFLLRVPAPLHAIRPWERRPASYRRLLVPAFGTLLRRPPLRYLNTEVYLRSEAGGARAVRAQVEAAEAAHYLAGVVLLPYMALAGTGRQWGTLAALVAIEVAGNVYPILHLRWTRRRLDALLARQD